ncbi:hypothetical protein [Amycolatopsis anabasis]|uniref:hypothetical protein n=1 Tax=Amycolatopsis anabasis TaxID=1840409 RepID=UPI00131EA3A2|nr:hypothetical protein [Amycolatopsis anabasis]
MTDFDLPPKRELPDAVRAEIRLDLYKGMTRPERRSWRKPVAAAAVVVALAGGAFVATIDFRGRDEPASATAPPPGVSPDLPVLPLDLPLANDALDRCWAALRAAGRSDAFPRRETWRPVGNTRPGQRSPLYETPGRSAPPYEVTVLARADGKPLVCDTTATTVTVSDPNAPLTYVAGTSTAALLMSPTGFLAGVSDEPGPVPLSVEHHRPGGLSGAGVVARPVDGMFLWAGTPNSSAATFTTSGAPLVAPPPALRVVDRPTPGVDRTSDLGRSLGDCLSGSSYQIPDPESFQPTATLTAGPTTVIAGRFGDRVVFCAVDKRESKPSYHAEEMNFLAGSPLLSGRALFEGINRTPQGYGQFVAGGLVPADTARMTVARQGGRQPLTPVVTAGTFLVLLPADFGPDTLHGSGAEDTTVTLYNARDEITLQRSMRFPE